MSDAPTMFTVPLRLTTEEWRKLANRAVAKGTSLGDEVRIAMGLRPEPELDEPREPATEQAARP
jgi:hypothetical protein